MAEHARWFALLHRPGPSLDNTQSIFEHPALGEHVAFLQRMRQRGYLVSAGPLPDEAGTGMTVLQVPPDVDVMQLATEDDRCVADGYLVVEVREWDVRFTA